MERHKMEQDDLERSTSGGQSNEPPYVVALKDLVFESISDMLCFGAPWALNPIWQRYLSFFSSSWLMWTSCPEASWDFLVTASSSASKHIFSLAKDSALFSLEQTFPSIADRQDTENMLFWMSLLLCVIRGHKLFNCYKLGFAECDLVEGDISLVLHVCAHSGGREPDVSCGGRC